MFGLHPEVRLRAAGCRSRHQLPLGGAAAPARGPPARRRHSSRPRAGLSSVRPAQRPRRAARGRQPASRAARSARVVGRDELHRVARAPQGERQPPAPREHLQARRGTGRPAPREARAERGPELGGVARACPTRCARRAAVRPPTSQSRQPSPPQPSAARLAALPEQRPQQQLAEDALGDEPSPRGARRAGARRPRRLAARRTARGAGPAPWSRGGLAQASRRASGPAARPERRGRRRGRRGRAARAGPARPAAPRGRRRAPAPERRRVRSRGSGPSAGRRRARGAAARSAPSPASRRPRGATSSASRRSSKSDDVVGERRVEVRVLVLEGVAQLVGEDDLVHRREASGRRSPRRAAAAPAARRRSRRRSPRAPARAGRAGPSPGAAGRRPEQALVGAGRSVGTRRRTAPPGTRRAPRARGTRPARRAGRARRRPRRPPSAASPRRPPAAEEAAEQRVDEVGHVARAALARRRLSAPRPPPRRPRGARQQRGGRGRLTRAPACAGPPRKPAHRVEGLDLGARGVPAGPAGVRGVRGAQPRAHAGRAASARVPTRSGRRRGTRRTC